MATPRFAWGIDIGNRALKAVKVVREDDRLRVDDFRFIEHETILSQAGDNRDELVQNALRHFVERTNFKGGVAAVGVSGSSSFARFVKLPPVEDKKIPEIVRFEAIQQIPFPLEDVEWSYQLFRQEDNPEVEVGIFAMRRELVNEHIKQFTDFDLNVQTVQMHPLAVYNALEYDHRLDDGTAMIIDVGAESTDLIIASKSSIWMRSIPIGGNNFTESLVKAFKLSFTKAEDLKRNAATSKYARQIFQAMRPVFADLVAEVQRSIGFYASVHRESRILKIIALGGTFRLPGLQKYLHQNLQLPVEKLDGFGSGAPGDPKSAASMEENLLSVVGAYGLAIQAMGEGTVTSSLLPKAIQKERLWQEKVPWFATAAALFIAGAAIPAAVYFYQDLSLNKNQREFGEIKSVYATGQKLSSEYAAIQQKGGPEKASSANLQTVNDQKLLWRDLMLDIWNVMPEPSPALQKALMSGDKAALTAKPRGERRYVRIEQFVSRYEPDLAKKLADANWRPEAASATGAPGDQGGAGLSGQPRQNVYVSPNRGQFGPGGGAQSGGGGEGAATGAPGEGRGFIITITVTTPFQQTVALQEQISKALTSIQPDPKRPNLKYSIKKWWLLSGSKVGENADMKQRLDQAYQAAQKAKAATGLIAGDNLPMPGAMPGVGRPIPPGGMFNPGMDFGRGGQGNGGTGGTAAADDKAEAYKDPVTGENVLNDQVFTMAIAVTVDPPAYTPPAPAEGAEGADGATASANP